MMDGLRIRPIGVLGIVLGVFGLSGEIRAFDMVDQDYAVYDEACIDKPTSAVMVKVIGEPTNETFRPTGVVIGPNYFLTVNHYGKESEIHLLEPPPGEAYRQVEIEVGGTPTRFKIVDYQETFLDSAIYRIATLAGDDADLPVWLDLNTCDDELGRPITLGGFGRRECGAFGTLHWGRNVVSYREFFDTLVKFHHDVWGSDGYVKYEVATCIGDSGSPWLLEIGPEWLVVALVVAKEEDHTEGDVASYRSFYYPLQTFFIDVLDDAICRMEQGDSCLNLETGSLRPRPTIGDVTWEGNTSSAWGTAGNWAGGVPTIDDIVLIDYETTPANEPQITSENAVARQLAIGFRETGQLTQTGGSLTVAEGVHLGVHRWVQREYVDGYHDWFEYFATGVFAISGGSLTAETLEVGVRANASMSIDASASVPSIVARNVLFGPLGAFEANANSAITLRVEDDCHYHETRGDGRFVIDGGADGTDLDGLANLTLRCQFANSTGYDDAIVAAIEVAGVDTAPSMPTGTDFSNANFVLGNLTLGRAKASIPADAGRVMIRLEDWHDNQVDEEEALYVKELLILAGATFQLDAFGDLPFNLYYDNTSPKKLIMGDADLDGDVDADDLSDVLNTQSSGAQWSDGDFDGDRDVDADDLAFVVKNYGVCSDPPQDMDSDGDVDLADYGAFLDCYNGPEKPYASAADCPCVDDDKDGDVDLGDYGVFLTCYNGPNRPPACSPPAPPPGEGLGGMGEGLDEGGACDGSDVSFDLQSNQDGQTISAGTNVWWRVAACVSGSNQGLATYTGRVELRSGSPTGPLVTSVTPNTALQKRVFDVGGNGAPNGAFASDLYPNGGPYMGMVVGGAADEGFLEGFGAAYYPNWTYTSQSTRMTAGVGRDDRKSALLLDEEGDYVIQRGSIDTTGLDAGTYYVVFVPPAKVGVLRDDVDLEEDVSTNVVTLTDSIAAGDSISFTISSE
jgi:hypothetical protein